jgi:hypothetical protein
MRPRKLAAAFRTAMRRITAKVIIEVEFDFVERAPTAYTRTTRLDSTVKLRALKAR